MFSKGSESAIYAIWWGCLHRHHVIEQHHHHRIFNKIRKDLKRELVEVVVYHIDACKRRRIAFEVFYTRLGLWECPNGDSNFMGAKSQKLNLCPK